MRILVVLKMVPDVVEELEVGPDGRSLDTEFLRMIVGERDDHALEEALILREAVGGEVVVVAAEAAEVEETLYTALAKGADRAIMITGVSGGSAAAGAVLAATLPTIEGVLPADLVLTGCQAIDDLDGMAAPVLAARLGLPCLGLVSGVEIADGSAVVSKEYAGGVLGEFRVGLPALLGIQAAARPPRYVPIAKVRAAMASGAIETVEAAAGASVPSADVVEMAVPEATGHAEMIAGRPAEAAERLAALLAERGLV